MGIFNQGYYFFPKLWFLTKILAKIAFLGEHCDFWAKLRFWPNDDFWSKFWFLTKILIFAIFEENFQVFSIFAENFQVFSIFGEFLRINFRKKRSIFLFQIFQKKILGWTKTHFFGRRNTLPLSEQICWIQFDDKFANCGIRLTTPCVENQTFKKSDEVTISDQLVGGIKATSTVESALKSATRDNRPCVKRHDKIMWPISRNLETKSWSDES